MVIVINGKTAVLKKSSSFEFISENQFFTGADAYTMSITFPLKGCPENIAIFGYLNRKDTDIQTILMDCEIHDKNFHRYGSISIVEISETEVKTQFLEGRSAQNFWSDLDEVYINEMSLGKVEEMIHLSPSSYWLSIDDEASEGWVALPWVNNTSGNIQNRVYYVQSLGSYAWRGGIDEEELSIQPYLLWLTKKIVHMNGLDYDFSEWESSSFRHLVVFNTFPAAWDYHDIAATLPHWTVTEFFAQLELLLNCEINIDVKRRMVTMKFNKESISSQQAYQIENIIDAYTVEIEDDADDTYVEQIGLEYSEDSHNMQKYYSCNWLIEQLRKSGKYMTWQDTQSLVTYMNARKTVSGAYTDNKMNLLHYVTDMDMYFLMRCYKADYDSSGNVKTHYMKLIPVNVFGPRIVSNDEDAETEEIKIVPVWLDDVDEGVLPFLECGTYGESDDDDDDTVAQPFAMKVLANGEQEESQEYFDKIYVGYWDGTLRHRPYLPHPTIDRVEITPAWNILYSPYTLRLSSSLKPSERKETYKVDQTIKYTFSFLSNNLPDVKSVFFIHGKRYLCEKITATISAETGMSQKLKGVFYRIL